MFCEIVVSSFLLLDFKNFIFGASLMMKVNFLTITFGPAFSLFLILAQALFKCR